MTSSQTAVNDAIFKRGSKTYYNASKFFPREKREEVATLYAFVRVADDFVDATPQDKKGFLAFRKECTLAKQGDVTGNVIVNNMYALARKRQFDFAWIDAFLDSMEMDLTKSTYVTVEETLAYIYGSAEVIGLFMARLMDLPEESFHAAQMLGRSFQFINFIRDIDEDLLLGRTYLPSDELKRFGLSSLEKDEVQNNTDAFFQFMRFQVERYKGWQQEAEAGYHFIPRKYRIPIKTAADMYWWTGSQIEKAPLLVYERKIKPRKSRILLRGLFNALTL